MANKKFSEFTLKTDPADVDFVVGYDGTDNVRIDPSNLGGGGASDLNGLSDCLVDTGSLYVGEVPSSLSGNPQGNTVLGIDAGNSNTNGTENTNIGYQAGYSNATGTNRVCVGYEAGKNGTGNTGVFVGALAGQGSGTNNGTGSVGIGWGALRSYSTGNNNVAIGFQAARSIGSAVSDCVIIGGTAGYSNSGSNTVLIGKNASRSNTSAATLSIGYDAGYSNTSGSNNTNVGYKAGYSTTTGASNTTLGYNTLGYHNGNNNVAIGTNAMQGASFFSGTGADNVAIGFNAGSGSQPTAFSNSILIGKDAATSPVGQSNFIVLGNSSHTVLQMPGLQSGASNGDVLMLDTATSPFGLKLYASGTTPSDARDKKDIEDLPYGLEFINSLKPRKYIWDNRAKIVETESFDEDGNPITITEEFVANEKGTIGFGFVAQELQEVDNEVLQLVNDSNEDSLRINYSKLVPVLVKAIQELKEEVELLKS